MSSSKSRYPDLRDMPARAAERRVMEERQIRARGISDPRVLAAISKVPRHLFVPASRSQFAYDDRPLPLDHGQTISQPYIVALMSELSAIAPDHRVLEIGTGSGYQTAILAELAEQVYSIEIVENLGKQAAENLRSLGYQINLRIGDGYLGWPEAAPFDAIVVTAAPRDVPAPLLEQLAEGGRLIIPVGEHYQELVVIERDGNSFRRTSILPVRFVPMTGVAENY